MVRIHPCPFSHAEVAQLVEQHLDMVEVVGSSPIPRITFVLAADAARTFLSLAGKKKNIMALLKFMLEPLYMLCSAR